MRYYERHVIDFLSYKSIMDAMPAGSDSIEIYIEGKPVYHQLEAGFIPIDNSSITINEEGKIQSGGGTPDWSAPENTPGYIKNRTHYKETENLIVEEHQVDPNTGEDQPGQRTPDYPFNPTLNVECFGWTQQYDENEPDGGTGGIKTQAILDLFRDMPENTEYTARIMFRDPNIDGVGILEEKVKLHKHNVDIQEEGSTITGTVIELYPDYFYNEKIYDDNTGKYILEGPGIYITACYSEELSEGNEQPSINSYYFVGSYFQALVDKAEETFGPDPDYNNYQYSVSVENITVVKLSKEFIPQTADWDVNDSQSVDFIKNRTHYRIQDTQEHQGFFSMIEDSACTQEEKTTQSNHSYTEFRTSDYIYGRQEGDNTLYHDLKATYENLDALWKRGIRTLNVRLNDTDDFVYTCNLLRESSGGDRDYYVTYGLTLDNAVDMNDASAIFDTDENIEGEAVQSKGILLTVGVHFVGAS